MTTPTTTVTQASTRPDPVTEMTALGHVVARRCPDCKGEGCHVNDAWGDADDIPDVGDREAEFARLTAAGEPQDLPCGECDGEGWTVTPAGRDLLAFLHRFGGQR